MLHVHPASCTMHVRHKKNDFLELWAGNNAPVEYIEPNEESKLTDASAIHETLSDYFSA